MNVVATTAAEDVAVLSAKTLSIRRARSQRIGHAEIRRSLLINQLFGIHLIADHEIPPSAYQLVAEFVGRLLGSALRKDPVVFLVFRRAARDCSQVARILLDLGVDHDGVVVLDFQDSGRIGELGQLVPARLDRAGPTDAVTFTSSVHQLLHHLIVKRGGKNWSLATAFSLDFDKLPSKM